MKKILTLIAVIIFCNTNLKAQEDDKAGWYVDGVKVTKLTCYAFKNMQLVVPYNSEWQAYDFISFHFFNGPKGERGHAVKLIPVTSINNFLKGKYFVYTFFREAETRAGDALELTKGGINSFTYGTPDQTEDGQSKDYSLMRWEIKYDLAGGKKKGLPTEDLTLNFDLYGVTKTGETEEFSQVCNCLKKKPTYKSTKLTKTYSITAGNRVFKSRNENIAPNDFTEACTYEGTKVDFNSLGGKSSSGNSNSKTPADKKATDTKKDGKKDDDDDKDDDKD